MFLADDLKAEDKMEVMDSEKDTRVPIIWVGGSGIASYVPT